jgi:cytochrome c biogenesis protein CcmG/thiol:disulfide interchange protein DsbE
MAMNHFSQRNWTPLTFMILVLGAGWIGISSVFFKESTNGYTPAPQVSFLSPDFSLTNSDGEPVALSDLRGQAVLLNFWGSWCPPCKEEMPAMQKVYQDYKNEGFAILAVNAAFQEQPGAATAFLTKNTLDFPILIDADGEVSRQYQIHAFPTSYFIDPDGIIQEIVIGGPMSEALLRTRVENLLGEDR